MSRLVCTERAPVAQKGAKPFRSESLRRAVGSIPCVACGVWGHTQAAHANLQRYGKGRGLKASDGALMALCCTRPGEVGCHAKLDQMIGMTADEAEQNTHQWIAATLIALIEAGTLKVTK
jgi:hypothetical protein